jgi:hypothetical protein
MIPQPMKLSPIKADITAHFSEPPAPPPQQPLPEKPDAVPALPDSIQPFLKRTNTERPRTPSAGNSPTRNDSSGQIVQLVEALSTAKKELDSQSVRLKDLEEMLAQEKMARESAEERAQRLELESRKDSADVYEPADRALDHSLDDLDDAISTSENTIVVTPADTAAVDSSTSRLQERLETMLTEMNEVKSQMAEYKARAEVAEAESVKHQQSLAEMVERIRSEDANHGTGMSESLVNGSIFPHKKPEEKNGNLLQHANGFIAASKDIQTWRGDEVLRKAGVQNGKPIDATQLAALERAVSSALKDSRNVTQGKSHNDLLVQGAPFISMISVVVLGVSMMAYLNTWQKGER